MYSHLKEIIANLRADKAQMLRLRRIELALVGGMILSIICYLFYLEDNFRVNITQFYYMLIIFWVGNLIFPILVITGWNKKFKDPSLTTVQMFWATSTTMIALYFLNETRSVMLMLVLLVIMFGSLNYSRLRILFMILYSIVCYIFIIFLLKDIPSAHLNLSREAIILFVYSLVAFSYSILARELMGLRKHMKEKAGILTSSLNRVELESLTDVLTGIGNRRYLEHILELQDSLISRKEKYFFSLCMVDLDHFKKINDTHGHKIGDKILQEFCTIIKSLLRKTDHFGRYGGEEFIIISPFTNIEEMEKLAQRIRIAIEETIVVENNVNIKFTASIGVTMYHPSDSIKGVLNRADEALYLAKERGRNQIVIL